MKYSNKIAGNNKTDEVNKFDKADRLIYFNVQLKKAILNCNDDLFFSLCETEIS
jgi:hypothetical protein